jgi:aldose 1-epimerase
MNITTQVLGKTKEGETVDLFTLSNDTGMSASITNYGGIITSLRVPDAGGEAVDVVLGFDKLEPYLEGHPYFGAIIGRVANRISGASFDLAGKSYPLAANDGKNHLHGGIKGFDKVIWNASPFKTPDSVGLELTYLSKDNEEGYPGNTLIKTIYEITGKNELKISFEAKGDKPTPIDLTHHGYFNLKDGGVSDILGHDLTIHADYYSPSGEDLIPLGEILPVKDTPLDFRVSKPIGRDIESLNQGYDNYFALSDWDGSLRKVAEVKEPVTGRCMEVWTTEPGVQFYTGNFLDGSITGKNNIPYHRYAALCLETQHYPDSVHHPSFPSIILNPGETYRHHTIYRFYCS